MLFDPNEIEEANKLNANIILNDGKALSIKMLVSLINKAKFIIANDTGPAHIASHLKKNGLALFGSHKSPQNVSIENSYFKTLSVNKLKHLKVETVLNVIKKNLN